LTFFRKMIAAGALLAASATQAGPVDAIGHWQGAMVSHGRSVPVAFDLSRGAHGPEGRFTSLTQAVMDYPLDRVTLAHERVAFTLGGSIPFSGVLRAGALSGTFGGDPAGTFLLRRVAAPPSHYETREVTFHNGGVTLHGSLCVPRSKGRHPAVILLHGSGSESRWGTIRYVADRFARAGVVALVYDKRGSGDSGGDWRAARYEDLARDALAGVTLLESRADVDRARIGLVGHSQGGAIAPLAASLAPGRIAFIVAEDTFAGPQWQQDLYRVENALKGLDLDAAEARNAMTTYAAFVDASRGALPRAEFERRASLHRDASWYDWMAFPAHDSWLWSWAAMNGNFDSMAFWRKVRVPTLLVYGEKDALQPRDETIARIGGALDESGTPYSALIVPGAQHNLTIQPEPGAPFFWWRQAPGLIDTIVAWVLLEGKRPALR
jgi:pimeloyl-ACP methyl ester carboxylesterase